MSLYKKNKSNNFNQKFKKMPIIKSTLNISYFNNTNENIINSESRRLYINTENNIFKDDTNNNRRSELKKYNLKNYKNIISKRRQFNLPSYEEQNEVNIITTFFDSLKLRTMKKEFLKNKTHLFFKNKDMLTKNKLNDTNFNYTNLNSLKRKKNISIPKTEFNTLNNFCTREEDRPKIRKNKTIGFPDIKIIKNNFKNLFIKVKELNNDLEKNKIHKIRYISEEKNEPKINTNKMLFLKNNKQSEIIYDDENSNIIKNKKYLNKYIEKLSNYKYKSKVINSFFEEKEKQVKKDENEIILLPKDNENEDDLRNYHKNLVIQKKIINQIKELKYQVKSNVDKDIFKVFNKHI